MSLLFPELDTPCVVVDRRKVQANIDKFARFCQAKGVALRPHIKTHKLPEMAQWQLAAGACGITCQKIGEAEVFADAGFDDILLTFNVLGARKLERLQALAARVRLQVVADNPVVIAALADAFASSATPLGVLVECDTGGGRCGVQQPAHALALAQTIGQSSGLRFGGLMTYPKAFTEEAVEAWFTQAKALFAEAGIDIPCISSGGTPSMWHLAQTPAVTEYRAGTYIYQDRSQVAAGACELNECALHVLTTVVSIPAPGRVIIDAGSKALTSDLLGLAGYGQVEGYPDAKVASLSEEHGILDFSASATLPAIGDQLMILPNHACPVSNLFDEVTFYEVDETGRRLSLQTLAVAARGKVS